MAKYIDARTRTLAASYLCKYEKHTTASMAKRQGIHAETARRILNKGVEEGYLICHEVQHRPHVIKLVYQIAPEYRHDIGFDRIIRDAYETVMQAKLEG